MYSWKENTYYCTYTYTLSILSKKYERKNLYQFKINRLVL